jgi:excinuclease ABC subunit A
LPGKVEAIEGIDIVDNVINIDQPSTGRSVVSYPATYISIFNRIRKLFASTLMSKESNYAITTFSFNVS